MPETELCDLFYKYKADKCPKINHSYSQHYYDYLHGRRATLKYFLEIGVGTNKLMKPICGKSYQLGASLKAWRDFFTNAHVFGLDIDQTVLFSDSRISCYYTDQSSAKELERTISNIRFYQNDFNLRFDVILDDGSHRLNDMITSFHTLNKYVTTNGAYIIEDVSTKEISELLKLENSNFIIDKIYEGAYDGDGFIIFKKIL